jgi:stage IV sporulation protein FB
MRIAVIAGCELRANWLFVAVMVVAALSGYLSVFLVSFVLVLLHEGCHALAARAFGFGTREIELLPFGGVARIDGLFELNPTAEFFIAAAGPACNVLLWMAAQTVNSFFSLPYVQFRLFSDANLAIAALNLLPALPLDGGRMLRGLLARHFDIVRVTRGCALSGIAVSALLAAGFAWAAFRGVWNLSVLLIAVFLCLSAWREYAQAPYLVYKSFEGKRGSLTRHAALPVRQLIARQDMRLGQLARRFSPGHYHFVTVVDDACRRVGSLDEEEVVEALMKWGADERLSDVVVK